MITNCLNKNHKGFVGDNGYAWTNDGGGGHSNGPGRSGFDCGGASSYNTGLGWCDGPDYGLRPPTVPPIWWCWDGRCGKGGGNFPGSYTGTYPNWCVNPAPYSCPNDLLPHTVTCHENNAADQSWNNVTQWSQDYTPEIIFGPQASPYAEGTNVKADITWTTRNTSTSSSYVDYGLTDSYGLTIEDPALVKDHSITLTNLEPSTLYHYRVCSNGTTSGDYTFFTPQYQVTAPSLKGANWFEYCDDLIHFEWFDVTWSDSVEYYVEVDDAPDLSSPDYTSGWISGTSWLVPLGQIEGTFYWRVRARDTVHTDAVSPWSTIDSFYYVWWWCYA